MESKNKDSAVNIFAKNLKAVMDYHHMRPMDLARRIEISPSGVGKLLKQQQFPTLKTITLICEAYGIEPYWLCSPFFRPDIDQKLIDRMLEDFSDPSIGNDAREEIIRFAEFSIRK